MRRWRFAWLTGFALALACQTPKSNLEQESRPVTPQDHRLDIADPPLPGITSQKIPAVLRRAYDAAGPDYVPRTHQGEDGHPKFINRLMLESSPYLLQHAHNPVNWYPWGDEAFERAEREDKLILQRWLLHLSLVSCHGARVVRR